MIKSFLRLQFHFLQYPTATSKITISRLTLGTTTVRNFSLQDAATALRPFYFMVHPDFFGQHPSERVVNENSLKVLNEYLAAYSSKIKRPKSSEIVFYMRTDHSLSKELKIVRIRLTAKSLRETVLIILRTCGLSVTHVAEEDLQDGNRPIKWHPSYYTATGKKDPNAAKINLHQKPASLSLRSWLNENLENSRAKSEAVRFIRNDIERLLDKLKDDLSLHSIRCDSVWGLHNLRGCLLSFSRLCDQQPKFVKEVLKDRRLVFSNTTGVTRNGDIMLSSEDVPEYWYPLLMTVTAYDSVLLRIPKMEQRVSSLLNGIRIIRKEKRHGPVMAEEYEVMLNKLINTLRRCQSLVQTAFLEEDLSSLQLIVDGDASPLTLSTHGQFLVPSSIPGSIVIDYIEQKRQQAIRLSLSMEQLLEKELEITQEAKAVLELSELNKDESVGPSQMVSCCSRLVEQSWTFKGSGDLEKCRLRVSHYYAVMQDGEICIPWDWCGIEQ